MSGDIFSRRHTMVAETRRRWGDAEKQAIVPGRAAWNEYLCVGAPAWNKAEPSVPPASDAAVHCLADSRIEIELGNGRLVRVGAGVDISALKRVLEVLDGPVATGSAPRRKRFS